MPAKRYIVRLSLAERQQLIQLVKTGKAAAYKRQRAQILLNADVSPEGPGLKDETIAQNLGVCQGTVERLRKRFVEVGFDQVLERVRRQHSRPRCLDGETDPDNSNNSATDDDTVINPVIIDFTRGFVPDRVNQGEATQIVFSIDNTANAIEAGTLTSPVIELTLSIATASSAEATLTVTAAGAPVFTKALSSDTINQGGTSTLTFTIDNSANTIEATGLAFDDDFPDGMIVAGSPNTVDSCSGSFSPAAGNTTLSYSGGGVGAGGNCAISVDVRAIEAGTLTNTTGALESSLPDAPVAAATLNVAPADAPVFTKVFSPATIDQGGETEIVFSIDNSGNAIDMTTMAFTDPLPDGLVVADTLGVSNDCSGAFDATAGGDTLAFANGILAEGVTCEIRVTVRAVGVGPLTNPGIDLTSSIAAATLTVNAAPPLSASMSFSPSTIRAGGVSTLTYKLRNDAAVEATSVSLSDTLPAAVAVASEPNPATTCVGGAVSAPADGGTIAYSGGTLADAGDCTISVDVTSAVAGSHPNVTETVTSSLGTGTPAQATLTVVPVFAGTVTFDVNSDIDGAFGFSSAEPGLTASLDVSGGTGSTSALPVATAGSHSVAVTAPAGVQTDGNRLR